MTITSRTTITHHNQNNHDHLHHQQKNCPHNQKKSATITNIVTKYRNRDKHTMIFHSTLQMPKHIHTQNQNHSPQNNDNNSRANIMPYIMVITSRNASHQSTFFATNTTTDTHTPSQPDNPNNTPTPTPRKTSAVNTQ